MSRAFTKEGDGDADEQLPPRPISDIPNFVTPDGLKTLEDKVKELDTKRRGLSGEKERHKDRRRKELERDLRYYEARVESARMVDPKTLDRSEARIGATLEIEEGGEKKSYRIVGEDQADGETLICWASPLASALLGARAGASVDWERGEETVSLKVLSVSYPAN